MSKGQDAKVGKKKAPLLTQKEKKLKKQEKAKAKKEGPTPIIPKS